MTKKKAARREEQREAVDAQVAMQMLGISRATLSRYLESGDLRGYKLGLGLRSEVRVYLDSIQDLMRKRQIKPSK